MRPSPEHKEKALLLINRGIMMPRDREWLFNLNQDRLNYIFAAATMNDGRKGRDADGDGIYDEKGKNKGRGESVARLRQRAILAKATYKPVNKKVRKIGDYWGDVMIPGFVYDSRAKHEKGFDSIVAGRSKSGAYKAWDITGVDSKGRVHAVEVKTIQKGKKNDRVDMKPPSIKKKLRDMKKFKMNVTHLVVVDLRGNKPKYYHTNELGAWTVGSGRMQQVSSAAQLKSIIGGGLREFKPYQSDRKSTK